MDNMVNNDNSSGEYHKIFAPNVMIAQFPIISNLNKTFFLVKTNRVIPWCGFRLNVHVEASVYVFGRFFCRINSTDTSMENHLGPL